MSLSNEELDQLKGTTPTESIDLHYRKLQARHIETVTGCIKANPHLKSLNIADNYVTDHGKTFDAMLKFVEALPKTSLTSLDISDNNVTNFGATMDVLIKLFEVLPQTKITHVNVSGNMLYKKPLGVGLGQPWGEDKTALGAMKEFLPKTSLTSLNCSDNRMSRAASLELASVFKSCPKLKMVDLSDNLELMSDEAANELAEAAPSVQFRITKKPEPEMVYQKNRNMGGAYGTTKQAMAA